MKEGWREVGRPFEMVKLEERGVEDRIEGEHLVAACAREAMIGLMKTKCLFFMLQSRDESTKTVLYLLCDAQYIVPESFCLKLGGLRYLGRGIICVMHIDYQMPLRGKGCCHIIYSISEPISEPSPRNRPQDREKHRFPFAHRTLSSVSPG